MAFDLRPLYYYLCKVFRRGPQVSSLFLTGKRPPDAGEMAYWLC